MTKILLSPINDDEAYISLYKELSKVASVDFKKEHNDLTGYDIYIGRNLDIDDLNSANKLKAIFTYKTGVDDFPLKELKKRNISLVNTHADSKYIAEYAFGLAIALVNRISDYDKKFRRGIWIDKENPYWESIFDLKIGLLGYGNIGKKINEILLNNHIDSYTIDRGKDYKNIKTCPSLEELIAKTDMLIMSLPKTSQTNNIIDKEMIDRLKGKYLVNVGRGNSIDFDALYLSLKNKQIKGAAIDTWNKKNFDPDIIFYPTEIPFYDLDNIILSPHQAINVKEGKKIYTEDILHKVLTYLKDGTLSDVVDLDKEY